MFRKFKLGPLVGKRTWGGSVGGLGFPILIDGGIITAPNLAIRTPADFAAGRGPQLEKAMAIALDGLKKDPPTEPPRRALAR